MSSRIATTSVILVRHGQTALNAEGRLRGLANPELTPAGIEQACETADALRSLGVAHVISSPLLRAVATARIIADVTGTELAIDDTWTDRDYGPWTGHRTADVIALWGTVDAAPDVEPRSAVLSRALRALRQVAETSSAMKTVVVTHDVIIRCLLGNIDAALTPRVETGSWAELMRGDDGWTIASIDNNG